MKEFWESVHSASDTVWLCKSNPALVLKRHDFEPIEGQVVLDHGVGNGGMAKLLTSRGCEVVSCDIAQVDGCIQPSEIRKHGPYDRVISHLVAQHMEDEELIEFVRSIELKKGGIATVQVASLEGGEMPKVDGPLIFRSQEEIIRIFAGWTVTFIKEWIWMGAKVHWWIARKEVA